MSSKKRFSVRELIQILLVAAGGYLIRVFDLVNLPTPY